MQDWRITRLRGQLALTFEQGGKRRRFSLGTSDAREAQRLAPAVYAELTRPTGRTVADLWTGYTQEKAGRSIVTTMGYTWKALQPFFVQTSAETGGLKKRHANRLIKLLLAAPLPALRIDGDR